MSEADIRVPPPYAWLPTASLEPGMVIARPVLSGSGAGNAIVVGVGNAITASTIAQLMNKGVECVAVARAGPMEPGDHLQRCAAHERRLLEIFGSEVDAVRRPLLDALIALGPEA